MAREIAISVYLTVFKLFFTMFNRNEMQDKAVFAVSFGGNVNAVLKELEETRPDTQIVILHEPNSRIRFKNKNDRIVIDFTIKNLSNFVKAVYHLATASHIIVDNYYGFLAAADFKKDVKCIQLWHAAGAIKQFGLQDLSNASRSARAVKRFNKVYDRFQYVAVGSEKMADIFKESFGLPDERFIRTGIPRTDFFFNESKIKEAENRLSDFFPIIRDKKMLLYAPTYRDNGLAPTELNIDLDKLYKQFKYEYVLFLRLHPAVEGEFENKYPGFVFNVSNYPRINDLLVGADILITDYSSIPFEFALLHKPMVFYAYDFEQYKRDRGLWNNYVEMVPGPVVTTTRELIEVLKEESFLKERIPSFASSWNEYSRGNAAKNVINFLFETEQVIPQEKIREHV